MARSLAVSLTLLVALVASVYQLWVGPLLTNLGVWREVRPIGDPTKCKNIPALKACEKLIVHQESGVVYLACSTLESRVHWIPAIGKLNGTGMSSDDYLAIYNPETDEVTKMVFENFDSSRGLSSHGMDIVPAASDPKLLYVFLVNHRRPLQGDATVVGADSVIEVFETSVGSTTLKHIKTVEDPLIHTPNDIAAFPDGKSFYVTNDHGAKTDFLRHFEIFGLSRTSVVFCHLDYGCKTAISGMHANNGIARSRHNNTIYVANSLRGGIRILERQEDDTLVKVDEIPTEYPIDNLSVDEGGNVWAAGFPRGIETVTKHFENPSISAPVAAIRMSALGPKISAQRVFENDGSTISGTTTVAYDSKRNRLYFTGISAPSLTVCQL